MEGGREREVGRYLVESIQLYTREVVYNLTQTNAIYKERQNRVKHILRGQRGGWMEEGRGR